MSQKDPVVVVPQSEQPVPVRKEVAGADSAGFVWPKDGAVVDVPYEHALLLVSIPDGGFSIVEPEEGFPEGYPAREPQDRTGEAPVRVVEPRPAPNAERAVVEPPRTVVEPPVSEPAAKASRGGKPETPTPEKGLPEKTPTTPGKGAH
jgi:hypothetical protein